MNESKKWLIIAHCFNMDGRAASHTITDRIPILMEKDVIPIVISAPTGKKDRRFLHYQVFSPAPSGFLFEMRHVIASRIRTKLMRVLLKFILVLGLLPFLLIEKIFINLDSHWSWMFSATIKGWRVTRKNHPDLVYSSAGPSSTHVAGYLVSRLCGLPWLAEVHDPLIMDVQVKRYQRYRFHRWLEKLIFKNADGVVYFTEKALASAENRTKVLKKGYVIRPGARPSNKEIVGYTKRTKLHFGYFGSLTRKRNLSEFLEAMSLLKKENPMIAGHLVLDVFGADLDPLSKCILDQCALNEMVCLHGRIEYNPITGKSGREQVFEEMHRCDVLLLVQGESTGRDEYIPSKIYEYFLTCRPILGIVLQGSEAERLMKVGGHLVVNKGDSEGIFKALKHLYRVWEDGEIPDIKHQPPYTIEKAVGDLLRIGTELYKRKIDQFSNTSRVV